MYALSFSDNTLILISESTPLLIKIVEKQWILTNNHSYKYSTPNQWIIHWFLFREYYNKNERILSANFRRACSRACLRWAVSVRNIINIVSRGSHYREQLDSPQGRYRSFTVETRTDRY